MRSQLTKFKSFELQTRSANLLVKVKVEATSRPADASNVLEKVWVKAYNIPIVARKEEIVKKIARLVGDPLEVDPISLIKDGPLRIKTACRAAVMIRGETEVFFNCVGRKIKWVVETPKAGNPQTKLSKFDRYNKKEDEEELDEASQGSHATGFRELGNESKQRESIRKRKGKGATQQDKGSYKEEHDSQTRKGESEENVNLYEQSDQQTEEDNQQEAKGDISNLEAGNEISNQRTLIKQIMKIAPSFATQNQQRRWKQKARLWRRCHRSWILRKRLIEI